MNNCIFCQIIKGEIPCQKVYEDDQVLAFLDVNPVNFGHTLVISKEHFKDLLETPEEVLAKVIIVVQKVGQALINGLGIDGFNLGVNNGRAAGQSVDHLHFHVMPRFLDDGLKHWPVKKYKEGEMEECARKIRKAL